MKKTTTSNPLKFFNDAKESRNKSFSKSLKRINNGGVSDDPPGTPFQSYMKTPGATATDTSATTPYKANLLTKNNPLLKEAYSLTYGNDYGSSDVANPYGSFESRRGDNSGYTNVNNSQRSAYEKAISKAFKQKKGGSIKSKKKK